eukprot:CAMPEP_0203846104 /NCGR_PEP_ID=MMETSP0359-20131031/4232_1 /ASSEMBLY_ACC=CAM_ASM_000338 /TAXON_ID=268821 /ORGANISM="Scrippsiella Hangoei, Strain SHTV-5" /LENGTH=291 /DNA_ID=CAMNT_0050761379 /DNA_START=264 /DNA_END=1136 /DNA_ORIENTATION=-
MLHIASLLLLLLAPLPALIESQGSATAVATTPGPTTTKASLNSRCGGCENGYTCRLDGPGGAPQCVWVSIVEAPKAPSSSSGSSGSNSAPPVKEDEAWRVQATAQADDGSGNTLVIIVAAGGVTIFLCGVCAAAYCFFLREGEKNSNKKLPGEVLDHDWGLGHAHAEASHGKRKHDAAGHSDHEMREHHEVGLGAVVGRTSQHHERHQDRRHPQDGRSGSAAPPKGPQERGRPGVRRARGRPKARRAPRRTAAVASIETPCSWATLRAHMHARRPAELREGRPRSPQLKHR